MDIYLNLFSASIALAGFIAVFLVFRYQTVDTYVDNRKVVLRSLLETQIQGNPHVVVRIQNIGKDSQTNDVQFFSQFNNEAVSRFVKDILELRRMRERIVRLGLWSIVIWGGLSIFYIIISYLSSSTTCIQVPAIVFFIGSTLFTIYFIIVSLSTKKPE